MNLGFYGPYLFQSLLAYIFIGIPDDHLGLKAMHFGHEVFELSFALKNLTPLERVVFRDYYLGNWSLKSLGKRHRLHRETMHELTKGILKKAGQTYGRKPQKKAA